MINFPSFEVCLRCACTVRPIWVYQPPHRLPHFSSLERYYYPLWKQRSGWGRSVEMLRHWQRGERIIECAIVELHSASALCGRLFRGTEKLLFSRAQLVSLVSQAHNGERGDISEAQAHKSAWNPFPHEQQVVRIVNCFSDSNRSENLATQDPKTPKSERIAKWDP